MSFQLSVSSDNRKLGIVKMKNVAIVSKDLNLAKHLKNTLNNRRFNVDVFPMFSYQVVTNVVLIDEDQLNTTLEGAYRIIQTLNKEAIVIVFSSKVTTQDKVTLLDLGIDDVLQKPVQSLEVIARINNVLKRVKTVDQGILSAGDVSLNINHRMATVKGHTLSLTNHEFLVLLNLARNKGVGVSRADLMTDIWGYDDMGKTRPIDNLIKRLRKKLVEAKSKTAIHTVWGEGYKIEN